MASGRQVCCSRSTSAGLAEESTDCTSPRMFSRSISCPLMLIPLNPAKSMPHRRVRRTLGVPRHPPGHRSSLESEPHLLKFRRTVQRPSERLCLQLRGAKRTAILPKDRRNRRRSCRAGASQERWAMKSFPGLAVSAALVFAATAANAQMLAPYDAGKARPVSDVDGPYVVGPPPAEVPPPAPRYYGYRPDRGYAPERGGYAPDRGYGPDYRYESDRGYDRSYGPDRGYGPEYGN